MSAAAVAQRPSQTNNGPLASQRTSAGAKGAPVHAQSAPPVIDRWQFEELLQCMICFESYRAPKMLKCGHTFCADCLEGYLRTYAQQRRAEAGKLPCPTCRELTTLPPNGVAGLRNDFKVRQIEDLFRTMNYRQKIPLPPTPVAAQRDSGPVVPSFLGGDQGEAGGAGAECSVCLASAKKTSKARVRCTDCARYYCDSCLRRHAANTLFQGHSVVSLNSHPAVLGFMVSDLQCKRHAGEMGRFLCRTCETIVCTVCVVSEHSDHDAAEVTAVVRRQQCDVEAARGVIQRRQDTLRRRVGELELLRRANVTSCAEAETILHARVKLMIDALRKKESSLLEELHRARDAKLSSLDRSLDHARGHLARAQAAGHLAASSAASPAVRLPGGHEELMLRLRTVGEGDVGEEGGEGGEGGSGAMGEGGVVTFLPSRIQEPDVGRVDERRSSLEELRRNTPPKQSDLSSQQPVAAKRPSRASELTPSGAPTAPASSTAVPMQSPPAVGLSRQLSQRRPGGSGARPKLVFSVTSHGGGQGELRDPLCVGCLLNGEIVVSEWTNKRLQVFDPASGRSVRVIGGGLIGPQGLAVTLKGNIIISDATQKRMQVFSPDGASLSKWGLGKFHNPCGVAVSANGNCVVTDMGDHTVNIYQGEKTCLRRFGTKGAGEDQFDNPLYVTTGRNNEIVVCDSNNHCLKLFSSTGEFIRRIGSEGEGGGQFKFPKGVCTDGEGNIVVADRSNDRVSLVSSRGRFICHLVTREDGIRAPYGVAMSVSGNLVVTENGSGNKVALKMFQL